MNQLNSQPSVTLSPAPEAVARKDSISEPLKLVLDFIWQLLSPAPPLLGLCGGEGHFHLQLHDQVVVGGALIDVLQGHNVFMLDPEEDKNPVMITGFR